LGLVQEFPLGTNEFAVGAGTWVILVILGHVNWQTVWAAGTGRPALGQVEALLGPSRLAMTATDIPPIGSDVVVSAGSNRASGIVVNRFRRATDVWGDIHVDDVAVAERIFNHGRVEVVVASPPAHTIPDRLCGGWLLR
jgi:hypothetical protein